MREIYKIALVLILVFFQIGDNTYAQTSGTLTFQCNTIAPNGWGAGHTVAIWIQNNTQPSVFIKTNAKYGKDVDHLTSWLPISGSNTTDATTGATIQTYANPLKSSWNGTNVSHAVVPDGEYKVCLEMAWGKDKVTSHTVKYFNFTKGPSAVHLTPANISGTASFTNITLDWIPVSTLIESVENNTNIFVYQNPGNGKVNINFHKSLINTYLQVFNTLGRVIYEEYLPFIEIGVKTIDLSEFETGIYIVSIKSAELNYTYKILSNHN